MHFVFLDQPNPSIQYSISNFYFILNNVFNINNDFDLCRSVSCFINHYRVDWRFHHRFAYQLIEMFCNNTNKFPCSFIVNITSRIKTIYKIKKPLVAIIPMRNKFIDNQRTKFVNSNIFFCQPPSCR